MVQGSSRLGFLDETRLGLWVLGQLKRQELERDRTFKLNVLGLVHYSHPAFPDLLKDLVMGDRFADHLCSLLSELN